MSLLKKSPSRNEIQAKYEGLNQKYQQLINENNALVAKLNNLETTDSVYNNEIFLSLSAGFIIYNFQNQKLEISQLLAELLEISVSNQEITIQTLIDCSHPDDRLFLQELFTVSKSNKKKGVGQFRLFQKTREYKEIKYLAIHYFYDRNNESSIQLICAVRDITKEIKQQKDLQKAFEKADESDKIKTTFLLNISHNIRTPMNSIMGFSELLSISDPEPERRQEFIRIIKRQSKSLLQLIDDVAEIAKFDSGLMTVTKTVSNLNFVLSEIEKEMKSILSPSRRELLILKFEPPSTNGIEIFTDVGRLHQIFVNLINFSMRFTAQGSIEFGYTLPMDNRIDFFVKDTGPGISKEELKLVFERYSQIDKNEFNRYDDETSLGLTIARSIVKLLGGKITVESDTGQGIQFLFSLPIETAPILNEELIVDDYFPVSKYRWNDKVLLIVEDEEVNGMFLEAVIHETQAQTLYVKNGKQAIELCKSINKIDLILMDIRMPVMNGIVTTEEIRKFNKTIPIIAQTALAAEEDKIRCMEAGCNETITKPIDIKELLKLIDIYFSN